MKKNTFSKEWVETLPKTINSNGCWIPIGRLESDAGYIRVESNNTSYSLHRVVLSLYYNIDYFNFNIETRHGFGCDRRCFNPKHLTPGSPSDNAKDRVSHGNNENANKLRCPRCQGAYSTYIPKSGMDKGKTRRYCQNCKRLLRRQRNRRKE